MQLLALLFPNMTSTLPVVSTKPELYLIFTCTIHALCSGCKQGWKRNERIECGKVVACMGRKQKRTFKWRESRLGKFSVQAGNTSHKEWEASPWQKLEWRWKGAMKILSCFEEKCFLALKLSSNALRTQLKIYSWSNRFRGGSCVCMFVSTFSTHIIKIRPCCKTREWKSEWMKEVIGCIKCKRVKEAHNDFSRGLHWPTMMYPATLFEDIDQAAQSLMTPTMYWEWMGLGRTSGGLCMHPMQSVGDRVRGALHL